MVVVKIELWPHGDESRARTIGLAKIANDGSGDLDNGNYNVELAHAGRYFGKPGFWKKGRVEGHSRELSPYHLVLKSIKAALGVK